MTTQSKPKKDGAKQLYVGKVRFKESLLWKGMFLGLEYEELVDGITLGKAFFREKSR